MPIYKDSIRYDYILLNSIRQAVFYPLGVHIYFRYNNKYMWYRSEIIIISKCK